MPNLQLQSPAVDFIENSLDKYHPAFATPPSRYDPHLRGFVIQEPSNSPQTGPATAVAVAIHDGHDSLESCLAAVAQPNSASGTHLSPRPIPRVDALEFWDTLFPQAMKYFVEAHPHEPEHLVKAELKIRDKTNWTEVFDQVEAARNHCSKIDNKFKAGFRNVYRKFGEHAAEPLNRVSKLVPAGGDMGALAVTPIIGCVQILLEVRRESYASSEILVDIFVDTMFHLLRPRELQAAYARQWLTRLTRWTKCSPM